MDALRQRNPFKLPSGEVDEIIREDDSRILDEQEQEEAIKFIRESAEKSDNVHIQSLRMALLISVTLQLVYLFNLLTSSSKNIPTPVTPFFNLTPKPPIPLAPLFAILTVGLHIFDGYYLDSKINLIRAGYSYVLPETVINGQPVSIPQQIVYLIAPILSILLGKDYPQTLFWLTPAVLVVIMLSSQHWMRATDEDLQELEQLRYNAQGA